jgi:hypothetical protein
MKKLKIVLLILAVLPVTMAHAQESIDLFSVPLSRPNDAGRLVVSQISGSINVIGYDGKEVIVKASIRERGSKKGSRKGSKNGLKRIANTSLKISAEEKDNKVRIINENHNRETNLEIKVPKNFSLKLSTINNGDIDVQGVNGEMEISNVNGEITLLNINGSATADTTNGDVKVVFNSINSEDSMAFSSFNGDVDITFPSSLKADVKLKSEMGDIFTDFDMTVDNHKPVVDKNTSGGTYKVKIEQWVNGKINGGGPEMLFKTFNGDIILRSN